MGRKVAGLIEEGSLKIAGDTGLESDVHHTSIFDRSIVRLGSTIGFHNDCCYMVVFRQQIPSGAVNVIEEDAARRRSPPINFRGAKAKGKEEGGKVLDGTIPSGIKSGAGFIERIRSSVRADIQGSAWREWIKVDGSTRGWCRSSVILLLLDVPKDFSEALENSG